ncbi:MAG: hypothetical protein QOK67_05470 [Nitrososphaeraceae archaeon]|nr:hypothetical protein [Nitrososphaeraceae archaeon]
MSKFSSMSKFVIREDEYIELAIEDIKSSSLYGIGYVENENEINLIFKINNQVFYFIIL